MYKAPNPVTELLGFLAVAAMVTTYALERRSNMYVLGFAIACAGAAAYAVVIRSWPFALAEAVWCAVALRRWSARRS
jgi:hypothetical protein